MKRSLSIVLDDQAAIELIRILMDDDAEGGLVSLNSISKVKRVSCLKAVER